MRKRAAFAASGFALAVALSACDGGQDTADTQRPASNPAGDGKGSSALFGSAQELGNAAQASTDKSKSSKFTFEANMAGQQATGQGEGRYGDDTAMSMNMDVAGQSMQMRFVDEAMYLQVPPGAEQMSGGKPWVKFSGEGDDPMSQMLAGVSQQAEQNDPTKTLEQIQQAGTITNSEQTELDGEPTTHYWVDLDFAKLADQAPGGLPKEATEQLKGKIDKLPMQVWLNEDQLPAQFLMDMSAVGEATGQPEAGGTMTMKYTDWGAPVDVQAPPADQVGTFQMPEMPGAGQPGSPGGGPGMQPAEPEPALPG